MFYTGRSLLCFLLLSLWIEDKSFANDFDAVSKGIKIFSVDFECQNLFFCEKYISTVKPLNPGSMNLSSDFANSGNQALKTMIGSSSDYESDGKPRAEMNSLLLLDSRYSSGETWLYEFSALLDSNWEIDKSRALDVIFQFKRFNSMPDISLGIKADSVVLRHPSGQKILVEKIIPGKWMNFSIYVMWSPDESGEIKVHTRVKGEDDYSVVKIKGANMRNGVPKYAYLKWGLYRPECSESEHNPCSKIDASHRIIYHDDISASRLLN